MEVKAYEKYRHYKGGENVIVAIAKHSESGEKMVVYKALYGNEQVWVRPYEMFTQKVARKNQEYRFVKVVN